MTPDLALSFYAHPVVSQVLVESNGENLIELPDKLAGEFQDKYGIIYKGEFPFMVPPKSTHVIGGHSQTIAQKLLYAVPFDVNEIGNPFFDLELLENTLDNAIDLAEKTDIRTLGIPSLLTVMFINDYDEIEIMNKTAEVSKKRLEIAHLNNTSLQHIYLLREDPNTQYQPILMNEPSLN